MCVYTKLNCDVIENRIFTLNLRDQGTPIAASSLIQLSADDACMWRTNLSSILEKEKKKKVPVP